MQNKYKIGDSDRRPWGEYAVIDCGEDFVAKRIDVNPGEILSLQRHKFRAEHWIFTGGEGIVTLDDNKIAVKRDDSVFIPAMSWHRVENCGKEILTFIEVQTGEQLDENDIERKEDKYARVEQL